MFPPCSMPSFSTIYSLSWRKWPAGGRVASHGRRLDLAALALVVGGVMGGLAFLMTTTPWGTILFGVCQRAVLTIFEPVTWTLTAEFAGASRATANGLLATSNQLGALGGASVGGLVLALGGFGLVGVFCLAAATAAAAWCSALRCGMPTRSAGDWKAHEIPYAYLFLFHFHCYEPTPAIALWQACNALVSTATRAMIGVYSPLQTHASKATREAWRQTEVRPSRRLQRMRARSCPESPRRSRSVGSASRCHARSRDHAPAPLAGAACVPAPTPRPPPALSQTPARPQRAAAPARFAPGRSH